MIICFLDTWSTSTFLSHISFLFSFPESRKVVSSTTPKKGQEFRQPTSAEALFIYRINQGKGQIVQLDLLLSLQILFASINTSVQIFTSLPKSEHKAPLPPKANS
mmetsp:Transcript_61281/g.150008  ORF Transcript_61281/g.150008 Transcript_61281/m.150008 type:complete len:105 (+) Transcript_61281:64-378(+)